jgi:hypothetical protein
VFDLKADVEEEFRSATILAAMLRSFGDGRIPASQVGAGAFHWALTFGALIL